MPFVLEICTSEDMGQIFAIFSDTFGHEHPYVECVFPHHATKAGRAAGEERFRAMMDGDPHTTFIKATDRETGVIAGFAKWNVYNGVLPEEASLEGEYWDSQEDKDLANEMFHAYMMLRREAIKKADGHLVSLDMMVILPSYQRMGAGKMLLQWGTAIADRMKVKTVVEATDEGRMLYLTEGFDTHIDSHIVKASERFSDRATETIHWMIRPVLG